LIKQAHIAVLGVLAALTIGSGCGGSDSSADTTVTVASLTKAEFVKRANGICRPGRSELAAALLAYLKAHPAEVKRNAQRAGLEGTRAVVVPRVESQVEAIRELGAPAGDVVQVEAILTALERSAKTLEEMPELRSGTQLNSTFQQASELARRYGLRSCAYAASAAVVGRSAG
jgi:hypothetical protein